MRLVACFCFTMLVASCGGVSTRSTTAPSPTESASIGPTASSQPSPSWSPPSEEITFTSDRYGYTVQLPAGWYVRQEGAGSWTLRYLPYLGAGTDSFEEDYPGRGGTTADFPGVTFGLYVSSANAEGRSLDEWTDALALTVKKYSSCKEEPARERTEVADVPATLLVYDRTECSHDHHALLLGVVNGDSGYAILWLARRGEQDARRSDFETILRTFAFTQ